MIKRAALATRDGDAAAPAARLVEARAADEGHAAASAAHRGRRAGHKCDAAAGAAVTRAGAHVHAAAERRWAAGVDGSAAQGPRNRAGIEKSNVARAGAPVQDGVRRAKLSGSHRRAEKDRSDLAFALKQGVDWIAMSFVQRPEEIGRAHV